MGSIGLNINDSEKNWTPGALVRNKKNSMNFLLRIFIFFLQVKNLCILHGHVFVMTVPIISNDRDHLFHLAVKWYRICSKHI